MTAGGRPDLPGQNPTLTTIKPFFSDINYSAANEDGASELAALRLDARSRVLCITASGARPLELLLGDPESVVAVDFNATQNPLLELKMAAYCTLDYAAFAAFIGLRPGDAAGRRDTYVRLASQLSPPARIYWDAQASKLAHGILYCGRWESFMRLFARLTFSRRDLLRRLFACQTLPEQAELWRREWDNGVWRGFLGAISQRWLWRYVLREPGVVNVPADFDVAGYLHARFAHVAQTRLFRDTPYLSLMLRGSYDPAGGLPLHLAPEHYETIRARLGRITVLTQDLALLLEEPESRGAYDAFSVSDFSSYASPAFHERIWRGMEQSARPGARVCERQFLVKHQTLNSGHRDDALERKLAETDGAFIYSFICVTL